MLSQELQDKFALLDQPLDFHARSELLSWFVDNIRDEILNHFEANSLFKGMNKDDAASFFASLDHLQNKCREDLFNLHQA